MIAPFVAPAGMLLVLALVRLALLRPIAGFGLFMALWVGGALVAVILAVRAFRAGQTALVPAAVALILIGGLVATVVTRPRGPAIHDLTTSPADAPEFMQAVSLPENRGRDLTYPHGDPETAELQRRHYPELAPVRLDVTPERALEASVEAARALDWTITWTNREMGRMEAYDTTSLFRFVDDIAVRVRADGNGSVVDVRSTSRVGRSDLGANAARIERFVAALRARLDG